MKKRWLSKITQYLHSYKERKKETRKHNETDPKTEKKIKFLHSHKIHTLQKENKSHFTRWCRWLKTEWGGVPQRWNGKGNYGSNWKGLRRKGCGSVRGSVRHKEKEMVLPLVWELVPECPKWLCNYHSPPCIFLFLRASLSRAPSPLSATHFFPDFYWQFNVFIRFILTLVIFHTYLTSYLIFFISNIHFFSLLSFPISFDFTLTLGRSDHCEFWDPFLSFSGKREKGDNRWKGRG